MPIFSTAPTREGPVALLAIISSDVSITWNLTEDEPQFRTRIFISVLSHGW